MLGLQECSDLHIPFVALGGDVESFFLVLGMGAIVDHVNGGLLAPESPHWAMGATVDFFLSAAFGPRKAHISHNQIMLQCGLA